MALLAAAVRFGRQLAHRLPADVGQPNHDSPPSNEVQEQAPQDAP